MVTPAPQPSQPIRFRYEDVPHKDQDWLRRRTEELNSLAHRTVKSIIEIGQLLADVRARIKKRKFRAWLADATPISRPQAYRFMAVAQAFGEYALNPETERIKPGALYILAQPSTPTAVRDHVLELARDGQVITQARAQEILEAFRPLPDLSREELQKFEEETKPLRERLASFRAAVAEAGPLTRVGAAVTDLARAGVLFHVTVLTEVEDSDEEPDEPLYSVTAHFPRADGEGPPKVKTEVRRTLVDAIEAVLGREELVKCSKCKIPKPVGEFGRNRQTRTGRNRYCKICERQRMADIAESRKRPGKQQRKRPGWSGPRPADVEAVDGTDQPTQQDLRATESSRSAG